MILMMTIMKVMMTMMMMTVMTVVTRFTAMRSSLLCYPATRFNKLKYSLPTPPAGGQEISFAPQMIFLWPPARGVGKQVPTTHGTIGTLYKEM